MTTYLERSIPFILNSNPLNGASNLSTTRDAFTTDFKREIEIPKDAVNIKVGVEEAGIWWVMPNISAALNNNHFIIEKKGVQKYDVILPDGLYDMLRYNSTVDRLLQQVGLPAKTVIMSGDAATNKVVFNITLADYQIGFEAKTAYTVLGCTLNQLIPAGGFTTANYFESGTNKAMFNTISNFLLHSDLVRDGFNYNNYPCIVANVGIDRPPGSLLIYRPYKPTFLQADHLKGQSISETRTWLTDQDNRSVDTNGEYFYLQILITYMIPLITQK